MVSNSGLASATPAFAAGQAEAKGFVEDSALNVLLRNAYINRDYKSGSDDKAEWGQGVIANFESGFTQGTVGVGVTPSLPTACASTAAAAVPVQVASTSSTATRPPTRWNATSPNSAPR
ncbi:OprD family outer membrane porin [Thauera phenylacetica]